MAMPRPRASPPGRGSRHGTRPAVASLAGGSALPLGLEYLGDRALLGVEELVVHIGPAAELADLEQPGGGGEPALIEQSLDHGAVALAREDALGLLRVEEV